LQLESINKYFDTQFEKKSYIIIATEKSTSVHYLKETQPQISTEIKMERFISKIWKDLRHLIGQTAIM
jgi:hypothetical protein